MSSSPSPSLDSRSRHHSYCRKQKSLGVLCSNFVSLYVQKGAEFVDLDYAARQLGVERRRIYDIVNVMESVGVVARKAKSKYSWIGFSGIPNALRELKEEALQESFATDVASVKEALEDQHEDSESQSHDDVDENPSKIGSISSLMGSFGNVLSATENRKDRSLYLLSRNFIKLFLSSDVNTILLDEAARLLLGDNTNLSHIRTRRLYDITNVLSSINLIEKIQESRKPAFRWLGTSGKSKMDPSVTVVASKIANQSNKRAFGTEVTNVELKRSRLSPKASKKPSNYARLWNQDLKECNLTAQKQLSMKGGFVFGPFFPAGATKEVTEEKGGKTAQGLEGFACSSRPQYHNEALSELFSHYMEAWKSWYAELAQGSSNLQQQPCNTSN
ncbi:E2F transcription factor-like E2FE isoform X1 [Zingiber officinale]|uniref:E2F transcription factor-like E2FE isoform X1 n=1 Tax=Zingiber officinale TaxID=94328 RepID=UPI001C4C00CC|nr:E2F transcription factor-like E2FE isoform X1 [Zingiber officinale]XP_042418978.1 E2F transcription factor-like E2FE isoform X1 [Zingiber officinale]